MAKHYALYGNVGLLKQYCKRCQMEAIVMDKLLQCCDSPIDEMSAHKVKRVTNPNAVRKIPDKFTREQILYKQAGKCLYCDVSFGCTFVHPTRGTAKKVVACWDHVIPYVYSQNNYNYNFVAACSVCNGIKSDKLFETLEEAREHVKRRRAQKGITEENYF